eukprot:3020315-Amphidinium_carterae.1
MDNVSALIAINLGNRLASFSTNARRVEATLLSADSPHADLRLPMIFRVQAGGRLQHCYSDSVQTPGISCPAKDP